MTPVALALSPHLDDAAFSCGGTLATLSRAGWRVVMATLFTRTVPNPTGFALACQLDKGLGPDVDYMALRRDEDREAARILGVEPVWGPLPEAPHRGYGSAAALFGPPLEADRIDERLVPEIERLLGAHAPALILAPQAIGGHVDHVAVVRALLALRPAAPVLWWRDFPYTIRPGTPPEPFAGRLAALPEVAVGLDAAAEAGRVAAARAYASQVGFQFGGWDRVADAFARAGAAERFRVEGDVASLPAGLGVALAA